MLNSLICGSFHNQEDDEIHSFHSCVSPRRSKRSGSFKLKETKNPYANRGLDKFDALLAELENKKQKIYTQKGAEDISLVRFVYSNDNKIKPLIVVKVKDHHHHANNNNNNNNVKDLHQTNQTVESSSSSPENSGKIKKELKRSSTGTDYNYCQKATKECLFKLERLRQPSYLLPFVTIFILLFLAIYGRPFAILCTSIGWYFIPYSLETANNYYNNNNNNNNNNSQSISSSGNPRKKKEYTRRLSDRTESGSSSPTSVIAGPADMSPRKHGHRKSF